MKKPVAVGSRRLISLLSLAFIATTGVLHAAIDVSNLQLVDPAALPKVGTFWFAEENLPPLPCPPWDVTVPVYAYTNGAFVIDDSLTPFISSSSSSPRGLRGFGAKPMNEEIPVRNFIHFGAQGFSLIDTNQSAATDTNLYNACLTFPANTDPSANLQIINYGPNAVLIKANHFDFSAEADRDFALLVSDRVDAPVWKSIDLYAGTSDAEDGWVIQGMVDNWRVTDPMYMLVSNIETNSQAFFRAIPYDGPIVTISGINSYDTVSNIASFHVDVSDLSGTSFEHAAIQVNGLKATASITNDNTVQVDTRYADIGIQEIEVVAANTNSIVFGPNSAGYDHRTAFAATAAVQLDFENPACVAFASDNCSPDVGTNYILFRVDQAQSVSASITDPATGRVVQSLSGYASGAGLIGLPWDFNEADGSPYTNDNYGYTFTAAAQGTTLSGVNTIGGIGTRPASGCIISYEELDPTTYGGTYMNNQEQQWFGSLNGGLYACLYDRDFASPTEYTVGDIGTNRDNPVWAQAAFPLVLNQSSQVGWPDAIRYYLTNSFVFSDFDYHGHGNGLGLGGGDAGSTWVTNYVSSQDVAVWVRNINGTAVVPPYNRGKKFKMRKVALWCCYALDNSYSTGNGAYATGTWPNAFGVDDYAIQTSSYSWKNVMLGFVGGFAQAGFGNNSASSAEVATAFDLLWVQGPFPYPGACDPWYSFQWATARVAQNYPEILNGKPGIVGYPWLPYSSVHDEDEIFYGNNAHVKP